MKTPHDPNVTAVTPSSPVDSPSAAEPLGTVVRDSPTPHPVADESATVVPPVSRLAEASHPVADEAATVVPRVVRDSTAPGPRVADEAATVAPPVSRLSEAPHPAADATARRAPQVVRDSTAPHPGGAGAASSLPVVHGYRVLREIARGGMGKVLAAHDLGLDRDVALKVLLPGANADRFVRESKITARLPHPGIPPVHALGTLADGSPFLAMKLIAGQTLADEMKSADRPRLLQAFTQICQAVGFAHSRGVIHRDLKPANIMVGAFGEVQVMDWGLAKELTRQEVPDEPRPPEALPGPFVGTDAALSTGPYAPDESTDDRTRAAQPIRSPAYVVPGPASGESTDDRTQAGQVMGTPAYMAPEQARGESVDARADVFALGGILCAILTGQPPFGGTSVREVLQRAATSDLGETLARLDNCRGDAELVSLCRRCLSPSPANRPANGQAVADALTAYLNGVQEQLQVVERERAVAVAREAEQRKRRRVQFTLAAAVLLVLVAGVAVSAYFAVEANSQAEEANAETIRANKNKQLADETADLATKEAKRADDEAKEAKKQAERAEGEKTRANDQLRRAEWSVYASKLLLAQTAFADNNMPEAFRQLDECQWNLRGWEHRHLHWRFDSSKQTLNGHTDRVFSVCFSPDGKRILTGSRDKTAKVWDAEKGTELLTLKGHTSGVTSVCFSPDGKRILTGSGDKTAKVWDAEKGTELLTLKWHRGTLVIGGTSVCFSPDGKRILTLSKGVDPQGRPLPGEAKVWDAEKGTELLAIKGHTDMVLSVCFSPDGKRILTGSQDSTAKVWDAEKGTEHLTLKGHTSGVTSVCFSPDGKRILTGSYDRTVKIWDAEKGTELLALKRHRGFVLSVCFSPDGNRILTSIEDSTAKVWDAEKGTELLALKGHTRWVHSVCFSPDGKRILTGSGDSTAKVWEAEKGTELLTLKGHMNTVFSVCFSPDGKRILTGSGGYDPQGRRLPGEAKVWDAEKGTELLALKGHRGFVFSVCFSPDGKRILTGSEDSTAKVWDAEKGTELLALKGHTDEVSSVCFSPDGERILTGSDDNTAKVWDAEKGTGLLALKGHTDSVISMDFSPDGKRILTGSDDKTAKLWDAEKGTELLALKGHTRPVTSVCFSPDGKRAFAWDATGKVLAWSAEDGKPVAADNPPPRPAPGSARSPDGRLAAKPDGNTVTIVDLHKPVSASDPWPLPDAAARNAYHTEQVDLAEKEGKWFAVAFHVGRLLLDDPDNADLKKRREEALRKHAAPGR